MGVRVEPSSREAVAELIRDEELDKHDFGRAEVEGGKNLQGQFDGTGSSTGEIRNVKLWCGSRLG